jgi:hypothetical protein
MLGPKTSRTLEALSAPQMPSFIEDVRGDDPELAAKLRIEERGLEAGAELAVYSRPGDQAG